MKELNPISELSQRRKLFLGAATEATRIAEAIHLNLADEETLLVTPWYTKTFRTSFTIFSELQRFLREHYFAAFVLSPIDRLKKRDQLLPAARDNVLFELGMFLGHAGPERTFIVKPRGTMHMPSDLSGLKPIEYTISPEQENMEDLRAALRPACTELKMAIIRTETEEQRRSEEKRAQKLEGLRESLRKIKSPDQHFSIITAAIRRLAEEKCESFHESPGEILEDVHLWSGNLLDVLDTYHLAKLESVNLREVWVYAPEPLELNSGQPELRQAVYQNLCAGVRYVYFVDGEDIVSRMAMFLKNLADEFGNGQPVKKWNVSTVTFQPNLFLGSFTIHYHNKNKKQFSVFQHISRRNIAGRRREFQVKLPDREAERVCKIIHEAYQNLSPQKEATVPIFGYRAQIAKSGEY